jgi:hypothetical protein
LLRNAQAAEEVVLDSEAGCLDVGASCDEDGLLSFLAESFDVVLVDAGDSFAGCFEPLLARLSLR